MSQSVYIPVCFVTKILDITAIEVRVSLTECKVTTKQKVLLIQQARLPAVLVLNGPEQS